MIVNQLKHDTRIIIDRAIKTISVLPAEKIEEVADFADYILKKHEETMLTKGIQVMVDQSVSFQFLNDDEDIYTLDDVNEKY